MALQTNKMKNKTKQNKKNSRLQDLRQMYQLEKKQMSNSQLGRTRLISRV